MRVFAVPMDDGACGFFRVTEPARAAKAAGVDVTVSNAFPVVADEWPDGWAKVYEFQVDCDVLILQRPLAQKVHAVAVAAKQQGIKIVVEMDDNLHKAHKANTVQPWIDPANSPLHNWEWASKTIELADLLTVSTPALAEQYGPDRSVVVRNRLPEAALACRPGVSPARGVIGWTGHIGVHPEDLQATRGALRAVDAPIRIVGSDEGAAAALKVPKNRITLGADWDPDIPAYWRNTAANIGIGIAPLQTSEFNRAKSWLKCGEYLALGIPFVASPLPEYVTLVEESGVGTIATSQADWVRALRLLTTDDEEYQRQRKAGIEWAAQHTLEQHVHEWIAAWEKAADL